MIDGVKCGPDGVRCDVDGNVWASSNAGRAVGYSGVTVWTPEGKLIGRIRLPGGLRQRLLRRAQAQPAVHGREPVALRRLRRHPGRGAGLMESLGFFVPGGAQAHYPGIVMPELRVAQYPVPRASHLSATEMRDHVYFVLLAGEQTQRDTLCRRYQRSCQAGAGAPRRTCTRITRKYGVKTLVYWELHHDINEAIFREKRIKRCIGVGSSN